MDYINAIVPETKTQVRTNHNHSGVSHAHGTYPLTEPVNHSLRAKCLIEFRVYPKK